MTLPDLNAVRRGLAREDVFVVVHDTHWSETARRADVVLPAATFLEKRDLTIPDHHGYCRLSEKAIEPLGESRPEIWVMRQLANRITMDAPWLHEEPWAALEKALAHAYREGGLNDILAGEVLRMNLRPADQYPTPSGKIEFAATSTPNDAAHLPTQHPLSTEQDDFVLLNSASANYTHSQFTDVYGPIPPIVWIHPEDAGRLAIADNACVAVFNDLATVTLHARLTDKVLPGTLWAPRPLNGLNGVPLNALVPGTSQQVGGGPKFNSVRVMVRTAAGETDRVR